MKKSQTEIAQEVVSKMIYFTTIVHIEIIEKKRSNSD